MAHTPACCRILRFRSFRISAVIAIPGIREGDADPQSSELQARHRGLGQEFPPTTGERLVDWTHLISTKSHGIPFLKAQKLDLRWWEWADGRSRACYNPCPRKNQCRT